MIAAGAFLHFSENSGLHFVKVGTLTSFRFTSLKRWFATFSASFTVCPVEKDDRMQPCMQGRRWVAIFYEGTESSCEQLPKIKLVGYNL